MIKERFKKFICENNLLEKGDSVLVAFSGGADSVCLLHLLSSLKCELDISVSAAHLHHGIRGAEADRDAEFARIFCENNEIPFYVEYKNIPELAKQQGISEEEAGRNARYDFFESIIKQKGIAKIATAHNKNDNAETILHHIIRGSGTGGLAGIPVKRGNIVRPVLFLERKEIENYCKEQNLDFVTDSTNLKQEYTRNRIRLGLLEQLKEFNPDILSSLSRLGENSATDKNFIEEELAKVKHNVANEDEYGLFLDVNNLKTIHPALQRRIVSEIAKQADISLEYKHIMMLLETANRGETGKTVDLPGGYAELSYNKLYFKSGLPENISFSHELKNGDNFINGLKITCVNPENRKLVLRSRQDGDKILAGGMHKKVKKVLIDKKIPVHKRNSIGVITADGEVAAVPGVISGDILKKLNIKIYCGGLTNEK
ncbi:MAG: tRNA lysidine(34) synthetase TilS [Clostridia bacterium]|nr:tRNA lysidine(34) synthetase TilS [Clostridia bacterium]